MELLKANFPVSGELKADETPPDPKAEFRKKALESIGGSMVFVERKTLLHDPALPPNGPNLDWDG